MKLNFLILALLTLLISCKKEANRIINDQEKVTSIEELLTNLEDSTNKDIIVVAHRGDWRNAPENSLQAIQNCIDMGVDMVEIDVRETKDGQLVVIHDVSIDRTTKAKGLVKDWTLSDLKKLNLVDGLGVETTHKIPTLEEVLNLSKDKILINLDKSYAIFDKCYALLEKTGTINQVIIKGNKTRDVVEKEFGEYLDKVHFMPIVRLPNPKAKEIIDDYLDNKLAIAFEFTIPEETELLSYFDDIRAKGASVWVNALWKQHNIGHDDEKAVLDNSVYDWYINNNVDIIQTDRPQVLLNYLRKKGYHK
ncbi:glycerophosphodiester phosphodiesterase family protein [Polaribacter sargassicola]|uniref:glycerophosphodiester phosphodiesterase family protein n=1 Tax=Polaribacter sargassicola TaxID=2836891 RepID=UPI001F2685C4|nr:glycerophosphodiester phosphodiesterase family protein [Polaribacter sp. DS7-9]MCG1037416.1 glycerophosphodiester phosphodiesterase family protein [Polaribacter sp. DS7-9]